MSTPDQTAATGELPKLTWTNIRVGLGQLKPWQGNPRQSTKAQAKRILQSFDEFGQVETVAVGPDCEVYDGHQRLSALLVVHGAGYEIDARQSSRALTEDERKRLVLVLHAGAVGSWDWDVVSSWDAPLLMENGLDTDTLKDWKRDTAALDNFLKSEKADPVDAEPQIDRAAELQEIWQVKRGDLWQIGEHRLLCGDSTSPDCIDAVMLSDKADMVFIDPPYGVDYDGGAGNEKKREKLTGDESGDLYLPILGMCKRACRKAAPMYIWFAASVGKPVYDAVAAIGYEVRAMIIWNKIDAHYGAFMSQYMQKHEPCLYIVDGKADFVGASNEVTVWDLKQPAVNEFHPTQKPTELAVRAIGNHGAQTVADFCAGSGTTLVACENLGRKCRAIEISEKYCAVILQRMSDAFPGIEIKRIEYLSE